MAMAVLVEPFNDTVPKTVEEKAPVLSLNAGDKLIHPAFGVIIPGRETRL